MTLPTKTWTPTSCYQPIISYLCQKVGWIFCNDHLWDDDEASLTVVIVMMLSAKDGPGFKGVQTKFGQHSFTAFTDKLSLTLFLLFLFWQIRRRWCMEGLSVPQTRSRVQRSTSNAMAHCCSWLDIDSEVLTDAYTCDGADSKCSNIS